MPNTLITKPTQRSRRSTTRCYRGVLTGAYVQNAGAAGEVLNFTAATDPNFLASPIAGLLDVNAINAKLYEFKVVRYPGGYPAELNLSTGATSWANALILKIFSAPGVELAAAAYPAGILADSFDVELTGPNGSF